MTWRSGSVRPTISTTLAAGPHLLVQRVTHLVHGAHDRIHEHLLVVPRGDAHVERPGGRVIENKHSTEVGA